MSDAPPPTPPSPAPNSARNAGLVSGVLDLFREQEAAWPDLVRGLDGLRNARQRTFDVDGFPILARHLPHRIRSTTAPVDEMSVSARPCFLCPASRPSVQKGIPEGTDFEIFCNPFPILENHLTIVCREHVPQRLAGVDPGRGIDRMLKIARELPGFMVLYNGPHSGASAPDHLHFQATRADGVPVFDPDRRVEAGAIPGYPGSLIAIAGDDPGEVARRVGSAIGLLPSGTEGSEPMMNVAVISSGDVWQVRLFPRARHRPGVFERGEFTWSPGAIDMCGVAVLPAAGDLERLTREVVIRTYREVSMPVERVREIVARLDASGAGR